MSKCNHFGIQQVNGGNEKQNREMKIKVISSVSSKIFGSLGTWQISKKELWQKNVSTRTGVLSLMSRVLQI